MPGVSPDDVVAGMGLSLPPTPDFLLGPQKALTVVIKKAVRGKVLGQALEWMIFDVSGNWVVTTFMTAAGNRRWNICREVPLGEGGLPGVKWEWFFTNWVELEEKGSGKREHVVWMDWRKQGDPKDLWRAYFYCRPGKPSETPESPKPPVLLIGRFVEGIEVVAIP